MKINKRIVAISVVALIACLIALLEFTGITHIFRKEPVNVVSGTSYNTKGETGTNATVSQSKSSGQNTNTGNSKTSGNGAALVTPSGNFVSNHRPNLDGSPAPNTIASVCNTTPGASCKIVFKKDGASKSLPSQSTDANGSTYWNWKLQDIGLTEGTWSIQAIATLNGQTMAASDSLDLVVSP